jgi:hypothetical protein
LLKIKSLSSKSSHFAGFAGVFVFLEWPQQLKGAFPDVLANDFPVF